jgi:hypothetical protein
MPAKASIHVTTPSGPPALFGADPALQTQVRSTGLVANKRSGLSAFAIVALVVGTTIVALAIVLAFALRKSAASAEPSARAT